MASGSQQTLLVNTYDPLSQGTREHSYVTIESVAETEELLKLREKILLGKVVPDLPIHKTPFCTITGAEVSDKVVLRDYYQLLSVGPAFLSHRLRRLCLLQTDTPFKAWSPGESNGLHNFRAQVRLFQDAPFKGQEYQHGRDGSVSQRQARSENDCMLRGNVLSGNTLMLSYRTKK